MGAEFIHKLPKIELHAHLNGSLKTESILELGREIYGTNTKSFINLTKNFISFNVGDSLDDCFQKFKFMHDLTATKQGLLKATQMVIRDFVADNVIYLELRTTPKANNVITMEDYLKIVTEAIKSSKEVKDQMIIIKLLTSIDRSKPVAEAIKTLRIVKELREQSAEYTQLLVGIDLSGNPNYGVFEQFKPILEEARQSGLKLVIHCAEIDNPEETREMLEFGMERCGHGTFLSNEQIAELDKRQIPIECCLTSNIKSATVPSIEDHHFKRVFEHTSCDEWSKNLVLCTDDSGVFDTTLSQELELTVKHFQLSKKDLIRLQLNAIDHSFASDCQKNLLRERVLKYCAEQNVEI